MSRPGWQLVEFVSQLLAREEREAVLGDLLEGEAEPWRANLP
jgi:hypothetical protein